MSIFVMGDLHLSTNQNTNKSMEIFGKRWQNYMQRIKENWEAAVSWEDTVIVPGDISWAMQLEEALDDFRFIDALPGQKLIGKGNHDFWWTTNAKMTRFLEENHISTIRFMNNCAYRVEDQILCGSRGWFLDEKQQVTVGDSVDYKKIVNREVIRLKLSLDDAVKLQNETETTEGFSPPISVFLHFPPVWTDFICREFIDTLHAYNIKQCYFGHIHGMYRQPRTFDFEGISMTLVSSDFLDFHPIPLNP